MQGRKAGEILLFSCLRNFTMALNFEEIASVFNAIFETKLKPDLNDKFGALGFLGQDNRYKVTSVNFGGMIMLIDTETDARITFINSKTENSASQFRVDKLDGDPEAIKNMMSQIENLSFSLQQAQPSMTTVPNYKPPSTGRSFP